MAKTVITCALTGSFDTVGTNPAVPVTPKQIADQAIEAEKAGAAIVHIHVRDPETTKASMDPALYREVVRVSGRPAQTSFQPDDRPRRSFIPGDVDGDVYAEGTTIRRQRPAFSMSKNFGRRSVPSTSPP